jgi:predicted amidophosphoribosyltransferase
MENTKGAFIVRSGSSVEGKSVLLIDDIFTTGATVNECSRVLLGASARKVSVFTLARG